MKKLTSQKKFKQLSKVLAKSLTKLAVALNKKAGVKEIEVETDTFMEDNGKLYLRCDVLIPVGKVKI